jgi:hypothetical protein
MAPAANALTVNGLAKRLGKSPLPDFLSPLSIRVERIELHELRRMVFLLIGGLRRVAANPPTQIYRLLERRLALECSAAEG